MPIGCFNSFKPKIVVPIVVISGPVDYTTFVSSKSIELDFSANKSYSSSAPKVLTDRSGLGNNFTSTSNFVWNTNGYIDVAANISASCVNNLNSVLNTYECTIEFVMSFSANSGVYSLLFHVDNQNIATSTQRAIWMAIPWGNGTFIFDAFCSATISNRIQQTLPAINTIHHYTFVLKRDTIMKVYLNGSTVYNATPPIEFNTAIPFSDYFLRLFFDGTNYYRGRLYLFNVFKYAATDKIVFTLYNRAMFSNLLHRFTFEEGSIIGNTLYNVVTGLNDTSIIGNPTLDTTTYKVGLSSLNVSATTQYISLQNKLPASRIYSFSIWVKTTTSTNFKTLFCLSDYSSTVYNSNVTYLNINNGATGFYENTNGTTSTAGNANIKNNTWHHIVWTGVGTGTRNVYFNASLNATFTQGTVYIGGTTGTGSRIGSSIWDATLSAFTGNIDDVQIFNKVLTAAEVTTLYNQRSV